MSYNVKFSLDVIDLFFNVPGIVSEDCNLIPYFPGYMSDEG
jgi:hypothetical protein